MKKTIFALTALLSIFFVSCSKSDDDTKDNKKDEFKGNTSASQEDYRMKFPDNATKEGELFVNKLLLLDKKFDKTSLAYKTEFEKIYKEKIALPDGNVSIEDWTANSPEFFQRKPELQNKVRKFFTDKVDEMIALYPVKENNKATKGVPGYIAGMEDGTKIDKRFVDKDGIELAEVLQKQVMGIILLDQIVNHHLSDAIMQDGNLKKANTERIFMKGKKYTQLEYHWDIAYALLGTENQDNVHQFLSNYLVNEFHGAGEDLSGKVYLAFNIGREALGKSDYKKVKESIATIRESLSKLFSGRSIFYLQQALPNIKSPNEDENTRAFHNLSETYGFIASFIVTRKANGDYYITDYKVIEDLLKDFRGTDGFWDRERLLGDENQAGSLANVIKRIKNIYGIN